MSRAILKRCVWSATVLAVFIALVWLSDEITLQGERTIYTVNCESGHWDGLRCFGTIVPGDRYRYRALKSRHEVIFWIVGSSMPSGKYSDCQVKNRDNWSCQPAPSATPSITLVMENERATHGPVDFTIPFRAVPKWKWWLLRSGIRAFDEASY